MKTPYIHLVPKDFKANLRYRGKVALLGARSETARDELWMMCKRDPLFWLNAFIWTYDPRADSPKLPFITYEFQDEGFGEIYDSMGKRDIQILKSRDMGASWLALMAIKHRCDFFPLQTFLLGSIKERLVDAKDNPDSLMWKMDFAEYNLPLWMQVPYYKVDRTRLHIFNRRTQSVIDGESTTEDFGRSGRRTAILLDEFAMHANGKQILSATRDVTNSRIIPSTPKGTGNAFYDLTQTEIKKVVFHWPSHPLKRQGLYHERETLWSKPPCTCCELGEGKPRSTWYDRECTRAAHPMEISQELDIDFLASDFQFFDEDVLSRIIQQDCREPWSYARIELNYDEGKLVQCETNSAVELWCALDNFSRPVASLYGMGIDVAAGTKDKDGRGCSNSCVSIVDLMQRKKVAAFTVSGWPVHEFAYAVATLGRLFADNTNREARACWEANGPGGQFGNLLQGVGYRNIYYRRKEKKLGKPVTDEPGWWSSKDNKKNLLMQYAQALKEGTFVNPSLASIQECRYYKWLRNGEVVHSRSVDPMDPSQARDGHGDRVIADALANRLVSESPKHKKEEAGYPDGSLGHRMAERLRDKLDAELEPAAFWQDN